ncbi:MAG: anhydro-N-acetylmuramic acid kinase [Flavobacteriaceae bacterium]|nr:anhydro-N-acetylmuramic acid kinase [Flavobacteriaceae bacterium]MBT5395219.1 anhydro-N-acetylmuramic acid kinase [Flavobacteriaceae bacterium]
MYNNSIYVIGLMSGTSLDGLDICFVSFKKSNYSKYNIINSKTYSYNEKWIEKLKKSIFLNKQELKKIDIEYGTLISNYLKEFISEFSIDKIDLISSHGHTVFHEPNKGKTLQIGDGKTINKIVKTDVVCDFRTQDVKYKGQGAPLVPIGDLHLFSNYKFCLNLGGFSNVSIKDNNKIKAFDICPVNTVLNHYSKKMGYTFDQDGVLSKKGTVNLDLLNQLNQMSFYNKLGPKSLGIEFVKSKVIPLIDSHILNPKDILRTYIEHISDQISKSIGSYFNDRILISGGGTYNNTLIDSIKTKVKSKVIIPDSQIIDYKEALIFAYMGLLKSKEKINCLKSVTGAIKDHSSGKIFRN